MVYTYDEQIISDLHKDARGFRPSQAWWADWKSSSQDQKQQTWDDLLDELEASMEADRVRDAAAVAEFEVALSKIQATMGADRTAAIRAYVQSLDMSQGDVEHYGASYICFEAGLPYSMAKVFIDAGVATHIG